jgi:16S rRNA (cytosine1402-N4)-methyltransferase
MDYHQPVLLSESVEGLNIDPAGIYIDATFGGGGHSKLILSKLDDKGHLFAFDQDEDARANIVADDRFTFVAGNFRFMTEYLKYYEVGKVDGILADLGVSSWQFDNAERGFSYREDHALDMRMNQSQSFTAADIIGKYSENDLVRLFSDYGQVRNAKTLAAQIVSERRNHSIKTIANFIEAIGSCVRGNRAKYLAQVFQSLRIEVNHEVEALKEFLDAATQCLKRDGRLVAISYHSVEDQLVKRWMKSGNERGEIQKDDFGKPLSPLKMLTKRPIVPGDVEIGINNRARSAKMRIAEKK